MNLLSDAYTVQLRNLNIKQLNYSKPADLNWKCPVVKYKPQKTFLH